MKFRIPYKDKLVIIYTKNIYTDLDIEKLKELIHCIDWDKQRCIILPSEYIKKIKFIKRK